MKDLFVTSVESSRHAHGISLCTGHAYSVDGIFHMSRTQ